MIIGENAFHMCWTSTLPQNSYYRILNSSYEVLDRVTDSGLNSITIPSQHRGADDFVLIQVISSMLMQVLPSRPFRVNISGQLKF